LVYIILDSCFILFLIALLIYKKRYSTVLFGLFGGILYTLVDFIGFYLISKTRTIYIDGEVANTLNTFWVLLWMSMSYGFTNFVFIWVCLAKDKLMKYWLFLIVVWWLILPSISELGGETTIVTTRTTMKYHGFMGIALIIGYFGLIVYILIKKEPIVDILYLFIIGFLVQFSWEFSLLINGIRPMNENSIKTILVNSCLETNLGMPYIFIIYKLFTRKINEDLSRK